MLRATASELTIAELSRDLGITEASLRHAVARGQLPVHRRWGRLFVSPDGVEAFLRHRAPIR
jgi:hypothetical protein